MSWVNRILVMMVGLAAVLVFGASVASAQDGTPAPDPYVNGSTTLPPEPDNQVVSKAPAQPAVASATQVKGASLAFTGGDVVALVGIGVVAIGAGAVLLTVRRRQHAAA